MPAVFALPDHLAAKSDPALIAADEAHFAAVAATLEQSVADLAARLDVVRRDTDRDTGPVDTDPGGAGQAALDRDLEVHRLGARLRTLRRHRLDLCLGRIVRADGETLHVGRLGLLDRAGEPLLVDWRSPAAEPFFAATHAHPMGLASRRRYRWTPGGSPTTGTRPSPRPASRPAPPPSTTSRPSWRASAAAARGRCATCSRPSRPTRTRSSAPAPAAPSWSTAARAPARPWSRSTVRRTCCTPTRASTSGAAGCSSSDRTGRTWPMSPTCCPAWARTA